jgi:preprotein translocase subunit YajC
MGEVILAASKSSSGGGNVVFLLFIVALFGLLYFVAIRPQRNRQRRAMQTQREVGPGAWVRTTAGMYATVVAVDGDDVILEIAPGVEVRYLRRAIMEVVSGGIEPEPAEYSEPASEEAEPEEDGPEAAAADEAAAEPGGTTPHDPRGAADGQAPADAAAEPGSTAQADGPAQPDGVAQAEKERPAG